MTTIADAAVRARALDPERSFIVQAPAGSGKTELLIQRYLRLLARVERPEEVLAITFTRKAASEMRERVHGALRAVAAGGAAAADLRAETRALAEAALARSDRLGWSLVVNPARLRILTIDGFFSTLVAKTPWLSRLGPPPAVAERPQELYERAAEAVLRDLLHSPTPPPELLRVLDHLDHRGSDLQALLADLLGRRDQWLRQRTRLTGGPVREDLERGLSRVVQRELCAARALLLPVGTELADLVRYAAGNLPDEHPLSRCAGLQDLPAADADGLPHWRALADLLLTRDGSWRSPRGVNRTLGFPAGGGAAAEHKERFAALLTGLEERTPSPGALANVRDLPPPRYSEEQWAVVAAVVRLVDRALASLGRLLGAEGTVDFAEIALRGLAALEDASGATELLLALDRRLSHVLVDEFQDTSHVQFRLLQLLTEGWVPGDGRTLFLVGDPMQSIYRFREAEVGLFLQAVQEGVGTVPLEPLLLTSNFRSRPGVVEWANDTFRRVFPPESVAHTGAVCYSASVATRTPGPGPAVELRARLGPAPEQEAREVAASAAAALGGGSVGILVRSRAHLPLILRALDRAGLPYQAQELDPLGARPVVRDIVSLTRALLDPADRLSWLSVLRAPWCGLELEDLHRMACRDARPLPLEIPGVLAQGTLSPAGQRCLARAWEVLAPAMEVEAGRPLRRRVEGAWVALGAPAFLEEREITDARATFDLLESLEQGGRVRSLRTLDGRLAELYAGPDPDADGRLQVMTIHKAKGLEFDTVLLPGLGRRPRGEGRRLLYWLETADSDLLLAPLPPLWATAADPIVATIRRIDAEKEAFERQRLMYVALTRARERAVLWAHAEVGSDATARPARRSLLEVLWPAVAGAYTGLVAEADQPAADPPGPFVPRVARLPLDWCAPEPGPAVGPAAPAESPSTEPEPLPEFDWAGDTARHVGTVVHRLLEQVGREGVGAWGPERVAGLSAGIRAQLAGLGVAAGDLEDASLRVTAALAATLGDPRGRWLLQHREDAASELELTGMVAGRRVRGAVDRTFVDEVGCRWIVDFKTSSHGGADVAGFLDREAERYRPQLRTYAALLRGLEPGRPLRAALYYPLLAGWREVSVDSGGGG